MLFVLNCIHRYTELMGTEVQKVETRIKQKQERVCLIIRGNKCIFTITHRVFVYVHGLSE